MKSPRREDGLGGRLTSSDCRTVSRAIQAVPTMVSQISPLFHTSTIRPRSSRLISLQRRGRSRREMSATQVGARAPHPGVFLPRAPPNAHLDHGALPAGRGQLPTCLFGKPRLGPMNGKSRPRTGAPWPLEVALDPEIQGFLGRADEEEEEEEEASEPQIKGSAGL